MIALLLSFLHIAIVSTAFGFITVLLFKKLKWIDKTTELDFDINSIIGIGSLSVFLNIISFFTAINPIVQLIISVISLLLLGFSKKKILNNFPKYSPLVWGFIIVFIVLLLCESIRHSPIGDTGLYHITSVKWAEEYPIIKGIANLHARLAFNSNLFAVAPIFCEKSIWGQYIFSINPYLFIVLFFRICYLIHENWRNNKIEFALFYGLFLGILFFQMKAFIATISPDLMACILNFYLIIILLENNHNLIGNNKITIITALTFFILTLKLSYLLSVLLLPIWAFNEGHLFNKKFWKIVLSIGIIVCVPWLLKGFFQSGYILYPTKILDVFTVDWKQPYYNNNDEITRQITSANTYKLLIKTSAISSDYYTKTLAMSMTQWLPIWFNRLSVMTKIITFLAALSPVSVVIIKKHLFKTNKLLATIWLYCYASLLFWFFTAPDFRFAATNIIICFLIPFILVFSTLALTQKIKIFYLFSIAFFIYFIYVECISKSTRLSIDLLKTTLVKPLPLPKVEIDTFKGKNFNYFVPKDKTNAFDAPLPNTPYINPHLELRGNDIYSGFKVIDN
jgi:hypothetical protein